MSRVTELIIQARNGDKIAAESLIEENSGLIWSVARRFVGRGVEADDLYQLGCVGFLKAVEGFDTEYGTQFSTYAVPKIAGEIRRFLRDDGAVKVSRGIKERAATIRTTRLQLVQTLGREPTISEIAIRTGLTPEEIAIAENATAAVESMQRESGEDGFSLESVLSDTENEDTLLEKIALGQAMQRLTEREEMVVRLRYYHGLTQQQVAKMIQVSQVQVSRIERKALSRLYEFLC